MAGEILAFDQNCSAEYALRGKYERSVLVAGGAGFLGSHISARLIAAGRRVICLDNLMTGSLRNVRDLAESPNFCFRLHDVIDPIVIEEPISEIYNLACPASPEKYQRDPLHTFQTSVRGAENLLMLAQAKGARILQASTSEVYGDPETSPQQESYRGAVNTFGPRACYDEGKRAAETLFYEYSVHRGLEVRVARIFNTYGPKMAHDDGRVVSNFIVQALMGRPITVYGDGSQSRSFCYVDDLVDGLMALMASPPDCRGPMNLGNPVEFTVLELAQKVLAKTGSHSPIVFRALPTDDPRQRRPDITRARERIGFNPKVALDQGLDTTIAYFAGTIEADEAPVQRVS
ncbi:MAG: SDR family oxidoreductase [Phaeovulum sp.]|uniref:UDP-glucuronic acid decarboxylase family protein n=1 Tax=Phaeovulum sp. TaxID=2934796 RepID=UPI002731CE54|nr:UDP-glucuronic acid decarboxylase family protein [Phaeovulum sp.]MDP2063786.1 SDR family oxidoreductase [Phaeovulum sp.]